MWLFTYTVLASALIFVATSFGCGRKIYPMHLKKVEELCKEHGGWAEIDANGGIACRCLDGKYFPEVEK